MTRHIHAAHRRIAYGKEANKVKRDTKDERVNKIKRGKKWTKPKR